MKEGKTKRIDELIGAALRQMGLEKPFLEQEVCRVWQEVVGQMIASRTASLRVADGKLFVTFTSAVVRNESLMVKEGLMRALNDRVGKHVISNRQIGKVCRRAIRLADIQFIRQIFRTRKIARNQGVGQSAATVVGIRCRGKKTDKHTCQ